MTIKMLKPSLYDVDTSIAITVLKVEIKEGGMKLTAICAGKKFSHNHLKSNLIIID